jgi:L-alanine-DL-glutamate epimerase-like enolase superfamily enzyme
MQITRVEVMPIELRLRQPVRMAHLPEISQVTAVFVRMETRQGLNAWGCAVAHPQLTGEQPKDLIRNCQACADLVPDLHPTQIEYSLDQLSRVVKEGSGALCAFDLAFHDLLGLVADMPLYRILGGYRNSIQTSATIPLTSMEESVEMAKGRARMGFRNLKVKGGLDPEDDVRRLQAIHRALPEITLRLDADGGYSVEQALDVARVLKGTLEMLEQPTQPSDLQGLHQVGRLSPVPVLADQSVTGPASVLELATQRGVAGISVKMAACGGLRCARQMDAVAQAAQMATMVSCVIEPALLIAAGLSFALSSPNVRYGDLDGYLDLINDPTLPGFRLEDGWLIATDVPGLGCTVKFE